MGDSIDRELHRAVGLADLASLCSAAFQFPTPELAAALKDGSFLSDWRACILDVCGRVSEADEALLAFCDEAFHAEGADYATMRREYSRLYLAPGSKVPVWPYESCFRHRAAGASGVPSLFRSQIALAVERSMHEAGVAPVKEHQEPGDSVFRELDFLAYLHAAEGEALRVGDEDARSAHLGCLVRFATDHALPWIPDFMAATEELADFAVYRAFARLGVRYLAELRALSCNAGASVSCTASGNGSSCAASASAGRSCVDCGEADE